MTSLYDIGNTIVDELKDTAPFKDFFQKGFLAFSEHGKIVAYENKKPVELLINDRIGNYFYLRLASDDLSFKEADSLGVCSKSYEMSIPARLIFYANKVDEFNLLYLVNNFLMQFDDPNNEIEIDIVQASIKGDDIYYQETGVEKKLPTGIKIIAFDLNIVQTLHPITDPLCLQSIKLCTDC